MDVTTDFVRLLHVDDNPAITELTATYLEREDERISVTTATGAEAALDILATDEIDCVVSDYNMPGLNGIEFLEAVRREYPDLLFILFTGRGSEEIASEAISAGVSDYLQKGGGTDKYALLANRVGNAVQKRRNERARERDQAIITEATDAILVVGADATVQYATPSTEAVMGRAAADLRGTDASELIVPADRPRVMAEFAALVADPGGHRTVEFRHDRPDGTRIWIETRGRNLLDREPVDGIVIYGRDVTDRKERETELRRQSRIIEQAPIGITCSDPSREDNPLVYANAAFEALTGYEFEEIVGRNCRFLQGERTDPASVAAMRDAIDAREPITVDVWNYRKDGTEFWNQVTISPIEDDDGDITQFVGFQQSLPAETGDDQKSTRRDDDVD
ncbi:PAS domain S-box protein [Haloplanus rubicundus]|uniref:PAS domain S-box protein n=1 Tax=Haloplanus rubicundus TaxID=1547898 RepID=A0A345E128_9EURY|nr:PAS domain S-box protein [Haloplanus rubicundus]